MAVSQPDRTPAPPAFLRVGSEPSSPLQADGWHCGETGPPRTGRPAVTRDRGPSAHRLRARTSGAPSLPRSPAAAKPALCRPLPKPAGPDVSREPPRCRAGRGAPPSTREAVVSSPPSRRPPPASACCPSSSRAFERGFVPFGPDFHCHPWEGDPSIAMNRNRICPITISCRNSRGFLEL